MTISVRGDTATMSASVFVEMQDQLDVFRRLVDAQMELRREGGRWRVWRDGAPLGAPHEDALRAIRDAFDAANPLPDVTGLMP